MEGKGFGESWRNDSSEVRLGGLFGSKVVLLTKMAKRCMKDSGIH